MRRVELGLLLLGGFFVTLDLLGALRIDLDAAIDHLELALEPHAHRIALRGAGGRRQRLLRVRCGRASGYRQRNWDHPAQ